MKPYNCSKCGETNPKNFEKGHKSKCKSCQNKESVIARRLNPEYQKRHAEYYKMWYAKNGRNRAGNYSDIIILWQKEHPEAVKSRGLVQNAIRTGLLVKPLECTLCGRRNRINGHHDDYNMPYDVLWVCSSCHKKIHLQKST